MHTKLWSIKFNGIDCLRDLDIDERMMLRVNWILGVCESGEWTHLAQKESDGGLPDHDNEPSRPIKAGKFLGQLINIMLSPMRTLYHGAVLVRIIRLT